jgi:hypothetical protein
MTYIVSAASELINSPRRVSILCPIPEARLALLPMVDRVDPRFSMVPVSSSKNNSKTRSPFMTLLSSNFEKNVAAVVGGFYTRS